jgi:hypothetical protein
MANLFPAWYAVTKRDNVMANPGYEKVTREHGKNHFESKGGRKKQIKTTTLRFYQDQIDAIAKIVSPLPEGEEQKYLLKKVREFAIEALDAYLSEYPNIDDR